MDKPLITVKQLCKNFGPTRALKEVDISFFNGEIRGLVGENGSGKSTITSIIAGMQKQTSGDIYFEDELWEPTSMAFAQKHGIGMVLQEAATIRNCTVAENIYAGALKQFTKFGVVNKTELNKAANKVLAKLEINHINAEDIINKYNYEDRKLVEIARCMREDIKLLVLDETTTALSHEGRDMIYSIMKQFKESGKSVIFISHDIDEILAQCTHVSVLRDGNIIGHLDSKELKNEHVVKTIRSMMVGRDIGDKYYREDFDSSHSGDIALEFKDVSVGSIKDLNLTFHKGEIVGFGGLNGSGMHTIARAAFGLEKLQKGSILRNGLEITSPNEAIKHQIGYISKNRDEEAIILKATIAENIVLPSLSDITKYGFVSPKKEKSISAKEMDFYSIKAKNVSQRVHTLSGGNKQKVSFAKWTAKDSDFIIMDCPTRGVDVGVKQAMYKLMYEMKQQGKTILMISEELPELIGMSDRIIIMKNQKVEKEFTRNAELSEHDIIQFMI